MTDPALFAAKHLVPAPSSKTLDKSPRAIQLTRPATPPDFGLQVEQATAGAQEPEYARSARPGKEDAPLVESLDSVLENITKGRRALLSKLPDSEDAELLLVAGSKDVLRSMIATHACPPKPPYSGLCQRLDDVRKMREAPGSLGWGNADTTQGALRRHLAASFTLAESQFAREFRQDFPQGIIARLGAARGLTDELRQDVADMEARLTRMAARFETIEVIGRESSDTLREVLGSRTARDFWKQQMDRLRELREAVKALEARSQTSTQPPPTSGAPPSDRRGQPGQAAGGSARGSGRGSTPVRNTPPPSPPPISATCEAVDPPDSVKPLVLVVHGVAGLRADGWSDDVVKAWDIGPLEEISFRYPGRTIPASFVDFAPMAGDWALQVQAQLASKIRSNPGRVVIVISHSWGSVATAMALMGGVAGGTSPQLVGHDYMIDRLDLGDRRIAHWITLGSPLGRAYAPVPLNLRQLQVAVPTGKPDQVDEWTNLFDVEDPIANLSHDLEGAANIAVKGSAGAAGRAVAALLNAAINEYDFTGIVGDAAGSLAKGVAAHMSVWYNPVVRRHVRETYWSLDPTYLMTMASDQAVEDCFAQIVRTLKAEADQFEARRRVTQQKLDEALAALEQARRLADAAFADGSRAFQLPLRMKDRCDLTGKVATQLTATVARMATDEALVESRLKRAQDLAESCADRAALAAAAAAHAEAARAAGRITADEGLAGTLARQILDAQAEMERLRQELDGLEQGATALAERLSELEGPETNNDEASPTNLLARILQAEATLTRSLARFRALRLAGTDPDSDAVSRAERLQMHINTLTSLGESLRAANTSDPDRKTRRDEALAVAQTSRTALAGRLARLRALRAQNECDRKVDPRAAREEADTSRTLAELAMSTLGAGYETAAAACAARLDAAANQTQLTIAQTTGLLAELEAISERERAVDGEMTTGQARVASQLQGLQQRTSSSCATMRRVSALSPASVASAERDAERIESLLKNAQTTASTCRNAEALRSADQAVQEAQRLTSAIGRLAGATPSDTVAEARRIIQAEQPALAEAINLWARIGDRFDEADRLVTRSAALRAQLRARASAPGGVDVSRVIEFDRRDASLAATLRQLRTEQSGVERTLAELADCQRLARSEAAALLERLDTAQTLAELAMMKLGQGYSQAAQACRARLGQPSGAPAPPATPAGTSPPEKHLDDIITTSRQVTITVWDAQCEDGDRITVRVNGIAVFENHTLFNRQESRTITLPSDENIIEVFANNGGTDCPPGATPLDRTVNSGAISVSSAASGGNQRWEIGQKGATKARLVVDPSRAVATSAATGSSAASPGGTGSTGGSPALHASSVSGAASQQLAGGPLLPLTPGARIGAGASVQTASGSQVQLQAASGTTVTISQNTQVRLPTPPAKKITLLSGTIEVTHRSGARREEGVPDFDGVETTDLGLTHTGTRYRVQAGASGTTVEVSEGSVHLSGRSIVKRYRVPPSENAPKVGPAQEVDLVAGESAYTMRAGLMTDEATSGLKSSSNAAGVAVPGATRSGATLPPFVPALPNSGQTPQNAPASTPGSAPEATSGAKGSSARAIPSWMGTSATPAGASASVLSQPAPWDNTRVQQLMDEWLRTAIGAIRAGGIVVRYNEWAQPLSQGAQSTGPPEHAADWTRHRYLWETRGRWTSTNLCTMREFIERRISGKSLDGCATGVPTWVATASTPSVVESGLKGNTAIATARGQLEVVRRQEEEDRRKEEQRRLAEQRRLDEERRIAEIRRKEQEKLDAQRRLEEERLTEVRRIEEQRRIERQKDDDARRARDAAQAGQVQGQGRGGFMSAFLEGLARGLNGANQPGAAGASGASVPDRPLQDIVVTSHRVTLTVWDDACEDGDRITVRINGQAVMSNRELFKQKESFSITLPADSNTIEVVAENGGTDCATVPTDPTMTINTGAIALSNATTGASQTWLLRQRASTVARIVVRP